MFDPFGSVVWIGLSTLVLPVVGLALRAPDAQVDATSVARTVDSVASSPYEATAQHPLNAEAVRVGRQHVALRDDGTAHASLSCRGVVPTHGHDALGAVLRGRPPGDVFADESAFAAALADAATRDPEWHTAPDRLLVRRVSWGDVDVTLVGGRRQPSRAQSDTDL